MTPEEYALYLQQQQQQQESLVGTSTVTPEQRTLDLNARNANPINLPDTLGGGEGSNLGGNILGGIGAFGGMAGDTLEQAAPGALGTIGGSALKGAATGAAFGPWGAVIGGAVGTVGGIIKNKQNNDAADALQTKRNQANILGDFQASLKANNMYEQGGDLNGITEFNGLGHNQGGIPIGQNAEVEDGETRGIGNTEDYIFSDKLKPKGSKSTFADESKKIEKKYTGMDNDRFAIESKDKELSKLMQLQETQKAEDFQKELVKLQQNNPEMFQQMMQQQAQQQQAAQQQQNPQAQQMQQQQMMQQQQQQNPQGLGLGPQDGRGQQINPQFVLGGNLNKYTNGGQINTTEEGLKTQLMQAVNKNDQKEAARIGKLLTDAGWDRRIARTQGDIDLANTQINRFQSINEESPEFAARFTTETLEKRKAGLESDLEKYETNRNQFQGGGQIDPPVKRKILDQKEYDLAKSQISKQYDVDLGDYLAGQITNRSTTGGGSLSSAKYRQLTEQYKKTNPIDYSGIALRTNKTPAPPPQMFGASGFDYGDKFYHSNSAAMSQYKNLLASGRQQDADALVLGYFDKSEKGSGTFSEATHGEGVGLGTTRAIRAGDLPDILSADAENKVSDLIPLLEGTQQLCRGGRVKKQTGGYINSGDDPYGQGRDLTRLRGDGAYRKNLLNEQQSLQSLSHLGNAPTINAPLSNINNVPLTSAEQNLDKRANDLTGLYTPQSINPFTNEVVTTNNAAPGEQLSERVVTDDAKLLTKGDTDRFKDFDYTQAPTTNLNFGRFATDPNRAYTKDRFANTLQSNLNISPEGTQNYLAQQGSQDAARLGQFYNTVANNPKMKSQLAEELYAQYGPNRQDGEPPEVWQYGAKKGQPMSAEDMVNEAIGNKNRAGIWHERSLKSRVGQSLLGVPENAPQRGFNLENPPVDINLPSNVPTGPTGDIPNYQGTVGSEGDPTKPFVGDYVTAGLSALPNIGAGIGSAFLGRNLEYDRARAEQADPNFVDPTRAIQESRDQYAGAKDQLRQASRGAGNYMSNLIGATASQSKAQAGIQSKYDNINAGIANQFEQFNAQQRQRVGLTNAQIAMQEQMDKTGLFQNALELGASGLGTGFGNYIQSKRDADMMNIAGGENYYYERFGPVGNQTPVRVTKAYGYETYKIPGKPTQYRDPNTGESITKTQATKRRNDYKKTEADAKKAKKKEEKKSTAEGGGSNQ